MSAMDRFHDTPSGVITDTKYNKQWLPKDSWQDLGKWHSWGEVKLYIQTMNGVYAGGFSDWRLPTKEEALNFYDPDLVQTDWQDEIIHIHPVFVSKCACYLWTSEVNEQGQALRVNLRDGTAEFIDKSTQDQNAARLVRDIKN